MTARKSSGRADSISWTAAVTDSGLGLTATPTRFFTRAKGRSFCSA
jgi:hypothetical protein